MPHYVYNGISPFIEELKQMHKQFCAEEITENERAILGSALLYLILPTNVIPDYVFSIGYLDDVIAVKLVLNRLSQYIIYNKILQIIFLIVNKAIKLNQQNAWSRNASLRKAICRIYLHANIGG